MLYKDEIAICKINISLPNHNATQYYSNYVDGGRADLTKSLSMNPAFQVTHSFLLGSQVSTSSYNFGTVFANSDVG